jgi:mono/diheme cytochrome c family protein
MLKQILREWSPGWKPLRWRATLIGIFVGAVVTPLLFLALPYLEIFNDMAVQPKAKPQGEYGWFSDQQIITERKPVPGTLPMNFVPYPIAGNDEKAAKLAGATLKNPLKPTMEVLQRGRQIFHNICRTCHGPRGDANGPIVGPDLFPAPLSLHSKQANEFEDGRIFHVITRGQNKMPSYAGTLEPEERWAVIHFVRALQLAKKKAK